MINTVTIWPRNPSESELDVMYKQSDIIAPDYIYTIELYTNNDNTTMTAVRTWPTVETAHAWADYLTANYPITSSEVCLGVVDTSTFGNLSRTFKKITSQWNHHLNSV